MRAVLDTNVLVSGLMGLFTYPARVVDMLYTGRFSCIFDDRIMSEYEEVLHRPRFAAAISQREIRDLLGYLTRTGVHVLAGPVKHTVDLAPDPDDLPFLEAAVAGRADFIITGNLAHFSFFEGNSFGIRLVSPRQFYEEACR